jgi:hypothetical protein
MESLESAGSTPPSIWEPLRVAAQADLVELRSRLTKQNEPIERRALVRSIFAYVEALTYALKRQSVVDFPGAFSDAETALLRETEYHLDDQGRPRERRLATPLKANVRFAISMFAKGYGVGFAPDCSGAGWQRFCAALRIRDRLMHPKKAEDFDVSDDEVTCALEAYEWFNGVIREAFSATIRSLGERVSQLHEDVKEKWRQAPANPEAHDEDR